MAQDFKTKFDINLPAVPNTSDRELHRELLVIYNSIKLLANAVEKVYSINIRFEATMGLTQLVNINDPGDGIPIARLAQHGVAEARGFVSIPAVAGSVGEVTLIGYFDTNYSIGVPVGSRLWLNTVPGAIAGVSPGAGSQRIGYTMSDTRVWFQPNWIP